MLNNFLPYFVYEIFSDGSKVLVACFATEMYAKDFIETQGSISFSSFEMEKRTVL